MSVQPQTRYTIEQYLELERSTQQKHEYYRGDVVAMGGASYAHTVVVGAAGPRSDPYLVLLEQRWRLALELVYQLGHKTRTRERDILVLERVGHAADTLVPLHDHVLFLHGLPVDVLRRRGRCTRIACRT